MRAPSLLPRFDWIVSYLVTSLGWDEGAAIRHAHECRLFLTACANSNEELAPPSVECDEVWHAFILHTREYQAFCREHVGRFIHHEPRPEGADDATVERTTKWMTALDPEWRHSARGQARCRPDPGDPQPLCRPLAGANCKQPAPAPEPVCTARRVHHVLGVDV